MDTIETKARTCGDCVITKIGHTSERDEEYDGIYVQFDKLRICMFMENRQFDNEEWGLDMLSTSDELVGAKVLKMGYSREDKISLPLEDHDQLKYLTKKRSYESDLCQIVYNIETDRGDIQLVSYNFHSGDCDHVCTICIGDDTEDSHFL